MRWGLVKVAHNEHVLIHIEQHLVHDGWSSNVFVKDLMTAYTDR